jgi:flagellar basal-body rod protein FlgB
VVSIIDNNTIGLLSMALDVTAMRQQAIAHNIANANTPGFQRVGVSFESRIAALKQAVHAGRTPTLAGLGDFRPVFETAGAPGAPVALDMEMAAMSANTLHQQTLLKALNKELALIGMAINEGKR